MKIVNIVVLGKYLRNIVIKNEYLKTYKKNKMDKQIYQTKFKNNLVQFMDELIEQYPTYPTLVMVRIIIKDQISANDIICKFVKEILPYSSFITLKNELIFSDLNVIYKSCFGIKKEKEIRNLKKLWKGSDKDNKKIIWKWFEHFLSMSKRYKKKYMKDFDYEFQKKQIDQKFNLI